MRNHTPETLLMAIEAMNPGTPVQKYSYEPDDCCTPIEKWKERLGFADMWHLPFTDPGWVGCHLTFHFADATYIHIKL